MPQPTRGNHLSILAKKDLWCDIGGATAKCPASDAKASVWIDNGSRETKIGHFSIKNYVIQIKEET